MMCPTHGAPSLRPGVLLLLLGAGSCNGAPSATSEGSPVTVPMPPVVVVAGTDVQLNVPPSLQGNGAATWQSSATSVATVTSTGLVSGVSAGHAVITARVKRQRATWAVAVETPAEVPVVTTVAITPGTVHLPVAATAQLTAEARDQTGAVMAGPTFTWVSADSAVATVSASGLVTAVGVGTVAIQASSGGKSGAATVTVAQPPPVLTAIAVTPAAVSVQAGATTQLTAIATDQYGAAMSGVTFTWASADTTRATVSSSGLVTAVAAGTVAITASSGGRSGSSTATITAPAPVATTVTLAPASATLRVGTTLQLTPTVKDQFGNPMTGVTCTYESSNAAVAAVSSDGVVSGVAAGQATITAAVSGTSATSTIAVTAPAPPSTGIWIGKAELDAIPPGSHGWMGAGELKATADGVWTLQAVETQDQTYNSQVMAGALVFARLFPAPSAESYRTKVVQALREVITLPDHDTAEVTFVSRNLGTFVIAADLINLPAYDSALDGQFRAWLRHKLDNRYTGGGGAPSVRVAAWERPNNIGAYSRFSLAAASVYLGDRATLDRIARVMRRWLGDTGVKHEFRWYNVQHTWQMNPADSATWVGINPKGAIRDGHNFDGLQPEEQERGSPMAYDSATFPNDYSAVRYNEVALEASLAAVLILHRAGYTDLIDASDQALLRAAKWIKWAADNYSAKGYRYFTDNREAARPLINYLYPSAGLPATRGRDQLWGRAFGFAWTYWTHGGRRMR